MEPTVQQKSKLLRFAFWIVVALATLTVFGLISEWISLTRQVPGSRWSMPVLRIAILGFINLLFTVGLAVAGALYLWARMAHSLPDLNGWHLNSPESEFAAADAHDQYRLEDYLEQENRVFDELNHFITNAWSKEPSGSYSRFSPDSVSNPERVTDRNWNRTQVLSCDDPVGGALLLHGLSDSPYSMRSLAERLRAEGYTVVCLRVPGHGTNPKALADVSCHDWSEAVAIAMKGLRDMVPSELPLILCGYSNGGALSLQYSIAAIDDPSLPQVQAIALFSPMIGINPMAKVTRMYHAVGLFSRNEKTKWSNIYAEIDPFKYSSWPMNANVQAWSVTQSVERDLAALEKSGRMNELPPVLAMQSVVDSTVVVPKLVTVLFDRLTTESSELFLFDVNRMDSLCNLINLSFENTVLPKIQREDRPYRLTVLGNARTDSSQLALKVRDQGEWTTREVELSWPGGVVSLSHVAVTFPPSDPTYGDGSQTSGVRLGSIAMRAEPNALMIPSSVFVRCRHNPFYHFMEDRVVEWLSVQVKT